MNQLFQNEQVIEGSYRQNLPQADEPTNPLIEKYLDEACAPLISQLSPLGLEEIRSEMPQTMVPQEIIQCA